MEGLFGLLIRWHYLIKRDATEWLEHWWMATERRPGALASGVSECVCQHVCLLKGKGSHYLLIISSFIPSPSFLFPLFSPHLPFCLWILPKAAFTRPPPLPPAGSRCQAPCHLQSTPLFCDTYPFFPSPLTVFNLPVGCVSHKCLIHFMLSNKTRAVQKNKSLGAYLLRLCGYAASLWPDGIKRQWKQVQAPFNCHIINCMNAYAVLDWLWKQKTLCSVVHFKRMLTYTLIRFPGNNNLQPLTLGWFIIYDAFDKRVIW